MIEGITFPDSHGYRVVVPAAPKTHDPDYLTRVNADFQVFLSEVDQDNVFVVDDLHVIRNISPHGLGGILVFDGSGKNFFALTPEKQHRMEDMVEYIGDMLEKEYGSDFHVVTGMATSHSPGAGMSQSVAFAHIHVSLFPKNISDGVHVHGMQIQKSEKPIPYSSFSCHEFRGNHLTVRGGGISLHYDSARPLCRFLAQNADRIVHLLLAEDANGVVYGTQWVIHRGSGTNRTLGVCPGLSYLPAFGAGLYRETDVLEEHLVAFEAFNGSVFQYVRAMIDNK